MTDWDIVIKIIFNGKSYLQKNMYFLSNMCSPVQSGV